MNILLYDMGSYTQGDLIYCLERQGCHCKNLMYKFRNIYEDDFFERKFSIELTEHQYDFVMSTNFHPLVAKLCHKFHKKYISWIYDSPINTTRIEYYQYPTNYIFLFDRLDTERLNKSGVAHAYHMPLAVNTERTQKLTVSQADKKRYGAEIAFVGQLYESFLPQFLSAQNEYAKGYINAIVEAQLRVYGYNFIEEMITDDFCAHMDEYFSRFEAKFDTNNREELIRNINKQVTRTERLILLNMLGRTHQVTYYSNSKSELLNHVTYSGTAHYFTEMPKIFRCSKLNLNPTLKSIQSGIPLRALDILSCGGTLFSNWQPELAEYFTDGENVILYESMEDALCKADYYLKHDAKREEIARNGYEKVISEFSYPSKIAAIFQKADVL